MKSFCFLCTFQPLGGLISHISLHQVGSRPDHSHHRTLLIHPIAGLSGASSVKATVSSGYRSGQNSSTKHTLTSCENCSSDTDCGSSVWSEDSLIKVSTPDKCSNSPKARWHKQPRNTPQLLVSSLTRKHLENYILSKTWEGQACEEVSGSQNALNSRVWQCQEFPLTSL